MSPPALPVFNYPFDMGEMVRDAADHNRSAISGLRARTGTEHAGREPSNYPKFEQIRRQTRPAENAILAVRQLKRYRAGWDGAGADAPLDASIRDCADFLSRTFSEAEFRVDLDTDGTVNLTVEQASGRILLTFEGDGQVVVSRKHDRTWSVLGTYPIRGELGRTAAAVERLISQA